MSRIKAVWWAVVDLPVLSFREGGDDAPPRRNTLRYPGPAYTLSTSGSRW